MLYARGKGRYDDKHERLWKELVPSSGQAKTLQGELVRAVGRLASESYRNGNMNWDRGFRIFINFLRKHLTDPHMFDARTIEQTKADLETIGDFGSGKRPIRFVDDEDEYDRLTDRVVEWCELHPEPVAWQGNPKLTR